MASLARLSTSLVLLVALSGSVSAMEDAIAPASVEDGVVTWSPTVPYVLATLEIRGPSGVTLRRSFEPGQPLAFDPSAIGDAPLSDGVYLYDLVFVTGEELETEGGEPALATRTQTGGFEVGHGQALDAAALPIFHAGSGSITGSLCVGNDCIASESFGFDTIRLKENNLRLHFEDTSTAGSFPQNDWRIIINDSSNGGANYFAIEDASAGRIPFRVEAGARANALVVEGDGDIGIGTLDPVTEVHIVRGDTPTIRLDQDGSSGFTSQVWDMAGNETNFFVRDVTNGSTLPFRIRPATPGNTLMLDPDGVGFNNSNPANLVHVTAKADQTAVLVDGSAINTGADPAVRITSGTTSGLVVDGTLITNPATTPAVNVTGNIFASGNLVAGAQITSFFPAAQTANPIAIASIATPGSPIMTLNTAGNLTLTGTSTATNHVNSSDINVKENIAPVDVDAILNGVNSLPISTWEYIADADDALHLGPMAQDFRAAFGLGDNDTTIGTVDASGVALAAIQALAARNEVVAARAEVATARIAELEAANAALEARLARLEALLGADHE